jgi:hypothetical protein
VQCVVLSEEHNSGSPLKKQNRRNKSFYFCNYSGCLHFGPKRSIFRHPAPLFSADALHRLQKVGLTGEKSPAFWPQNRYPE